MISRRGIEQVIGVAILGLLAVGCFLSLRPFLPSILLAIILTHTTWPLYERLRTCFGGRSGLAASVMIVAVACVLVVPVAVLGWSMTDNVVRLTVTIRSWFESGPPAPPEWFAAIPLFGRWLTNRWVELSQTGVDLTDKIAPHVAVVRTWLLNVGTGLIRALFELLMSLFIAFFLYCNGEATREALESIGEHLTGDRGRRLIAVVASTTRSVVEGLLAANLLQAALGALGFWVAGVPAPILLAFFLFFLSVVPFGAALVWVPAVVWLANIGHGTAAVVLAAWCLFAFPVVENVVRAYLAKRGSPLPGLLVFLGMLGGLSTFGFFGIFLGPALLALAYTLLEEWYSAAKTTNQVVLS